MPVHHWLASFGEVIAESDLEPGPARDLAQAIGNRNSSSAEIVEIRQEADTRRTALFLNIEVQRPQKIAHAIRRIEPVAIIFWSKDTRPGVFSLREDFPDTPHQNWVPRDAPASLCVDDRPWPEAKLSYTPWDFLWRVEQWLSKAARGELHDPAQPLDPIFLPSGDTLLISSAALVDSTEPVELSGYYRHDNPGFIVTEPYISAPPGAAGFAVISYQLPAQAMPRMRHAPTTLGQLNDELAEHDIRLIEDLKKRLRGWAGLNPDSMRRLAERLVVVVQFPVTGAGRTANDMRAFLTPDCAGDIGVALGVLLHNVNGKGYSPMIGDQPSVAESKKVFPAQVHLFLDRDLAADISGHGHADRRQTVLIGAGSLGSQLAINIAREGMYQWTVIDGDTLLPHNLARHALFRSSVPAPKSFALAHEMGQLFGEHVDALRCDVLAPPPDGVELLAAKFAKAELIIDASASVAVSRHMSDLPDVSARRFSVFFNPAGTAAILLAEDASRQVTSRDLESQYYRLLLNDPDLAGHLQETGPGVRYSGSCRALTNRIPATRAALLSALIARGIMDRVKQDTAEITIWTCADDGSVKVTQSAGQRVFHTEALDWSIHYDQGLLDQLTARRAAKLPNETGGVLLGLVDMSRRSIHITHAMPQPIDSKGSVTAFERGVVGLADAVKEATAATMHQIRYVGEWHSHPKYSSASPSKKDLSQLAWLESELNQDGLPGLMMIAGDREDFRIAVMMSDPESGNEETAKRNGIR